VQEIEFLIHFRDGFYDLSRRLLLLFSLLQRLLLAFHFQKRKFEHELAAISVGL